MRLSLPFFEFLSYPAVFLIPGYRSYKAVLTKDTNDDTRWLYYWLCFSIFHFIEHIISFAIPFIPLYYEIKCFSFLMFQWDDAIYSQELFNQYIRPVIDFYENKIDATIEKYSQSPLQFIQEN